MNTEAAAGGRLIKRPERARVLIEQFNGIDFTVYERSVIIRMRKINVQMYSFFDGKHDDSRENLKAAAELGYDGVELFGPNFSIPAAEMKELLGELKLTPVSLHAPQPEQVEGMIPYAKEIGMKFIGIGMKVMLDDAAVHEFAKELNCIGKKCRENGLTLTYHNHTQEFMPCDDTIVIDVLMKETDPDYVSFELDAGWCAAAGTDPVEFVKKYSGRVKLIHVKESSEAVGPQPPLDFNDFPKDESGFPILTEEVKERLSRLDRINCRACDGLVDWTRLAEVADANGCEAYIVEREYSEGDRIEALADDIRRYREVL